MKLLKELCESPGISGHEQKIIDIMSRELKKITDSVYCDGIGNVIAYKKSNSKNSLKIMLAAHMDEIGFIVTHIDANGFIRFSGRGGHLPRVLQSQRVQICGRNHSVLGVVESSPSWISSDRDSSQKAPEIKDMFIDTGLTLKELSKKIEIGDAIVLDRSFVEQGDICIAKAFDDRIGCYVLLEAMKRLKDKPLKVDVYAVGTAQEEVGIRGALTAARVIKPDIGIALDVTSAMDVPSVAEHQQVSKLGAGTAIKIHDGGSISNRGFVEFLKSLARKHKIKFQLEVLPFGGTDARGMQMFGEGPVCTISIPTRFVHSPNEIIHKKDVEASIELLVRFLENAQSCKMSF